MTEVPGALRTLLETGWSLARRSPAATVALARLHGVVEPEAVPQEIRSAVMRELEEAAGRACLPLDGRTVEKALKAAWGRPPGKVLDELDPEPLAVRAGAQVHAGEHDGEPVVVKVRRPGLEATVRSDIALLDALTVPLRSAFPALDAGALLRGARERVLDEIDLEHEAATQRQVARALRGIDGVVVPRPLTDLCAPDVLVAERLDGPTLESAPAADPAAIAETLVRAHVAAAQAGFALADARRGHVVLLDDGNIGLLGAGLAAPLDRGRFGLAQDAAAALRSGDAAAFTRAVGPGGMALLPADAAARAHALLRQLGAELLAGPARLDHALLASLAERAFHRLPELLALGQVVTPQPQDIWAARTVGQLAALLAHLGATRDWPALALDG